MKESIKIIFEDFYKTVLNFLFPQFCIKCGKFGFIYCDACIQKHPLYKDQKCFVCNKYSPQGKTHQKCRKKKTPDQLLVISKYTRIERELLHKLKYKNRRDCAELIANIIIKSKDCFNFKGYTICPIPLHKKKLKERGYNQVTLISQFLAKHFQLNLNQMLVRTKNTEPQNKLNRTERYKNLEKAFEINDNAKISRNVLLIDDLTTSGSTFYEATKVLKGVGVKRVICLAFARGK